MNDSYFLQFIVPSGQDIALTTYNADDGHADAEARDSDVDPEKTLTAVFTVPDTGTDDSQDAGVMDCASVGGLDLVFVVDTPGSMGGEVDNIRTNAATIINNVQATVTNTHFGLVSFQDVSPSYPARLDAPLSADPASFITGLNRLYAYGGGDYPETVYAGLDMAVNIGFRPTTKRVIVLIGDASPKDPDPHTGQKMADIVAAVNGQNATVVAVMARGAYLPAFNTLATDTGGSVVPTINAIHTTDAIMDL